MNITKLTLTPIVSQAAKVVIKNPTRDTAQLLITERLASANVHYGTKRITGKMPKFLKNFVNPKTYIGPVNKVN